MKKVLTKDNFDRTLAVAYDGNIWEIRGNRHGYQPMTTDREYQKGWGRFGRYGWRVQTYNENTGVMTGYLCSLAN